MFNRTKVITAWEGLVGFQNSINPTYALADDDSTASSSGRMFTDHPMCKMEFLYDNMDYKSLTTAQFNDELDKIEKIAITNVADMLLEGFDFIDRQVLYQYANNKQDTEVLPLGFVGYRIRQALEKNMAFEITRDILEFSGEGNIKLLLFNSQLATPLYYKEVTISSGLKEQALNWKIDNTNSFYKGDFFYGYLTDGLSVTPYKREYELSNIKSLITFLDFENIKVPDVSSEALWDLESTEGASECWGLNPDISVYYDYTNSLVQNKVLFSKAIQLQGQIEIIKMIMASIRSNQTERNAKDLLGRMLIEVEGAEFTDGPKKTGLKQELAGEMNRIRKEIKRLREGFFSGGIQVITAK